MHETRTTPIIDTNIDTNGSVQGGEGKKEEAGEKKKKSNILSLKTRIKRYSTKKVAKHHVEEVEVDLRSDESSDSGGEETDQV